MDGYVDGEVRIINVSTLHTATTSPQYIPLHCSPETVHMQVGGIVGERDINPIKC